MSQKTVFYMDAQLAALDNLWVGLRDGGVEVADADYVRPQLSLGAAANGPLPNSRQRASDANLDFGTAGTATGYEFDEVVIYDAASGGNALRFAPWDAAIPVGGITRIDAGNLIVVEV